MDENAAFWMMRRKLTCSFPIADRVCGAVCGFTNVGEVGEEDEKDRKLARQKLMIAIGLCFTFMIVEVIGGSLLKFQFA